MLVLTGSGCSTDPDGDLDTAEGGTDAGPVAIDLGPVQPGAPTLTEMVEGNDQSAAVDQAVAIRPRIRVTDSEGIAVPGVEVLFEVDVGGGTVEGATQETGADGTAAVGAWRLGPTPGFNRLKGEVPGLAPIFFEATATADSRGAMVIAEGNNQSATINTAVPTAPTVRVTDGAGDPAVGQEVRFEVLSGGGSIEGGTATTDAAGLASVGRWVLGPNAGPQALQASTDNLPSITFSASAVSNEAPVLRRQTWIRGLNRPWDIAFLPDGTMLITEKGGRVRAAAPGETTTRVIADEIEDVDNSGQSGMLGIAVDPDFNTNRYVYIYLSSERGGSTDNRVRRWTLSADGNQLVEDRDILTGITWDSRGAHSGGRLEFGPDGYLYVTTGDVRRPTVPQDMMQMGGKVLRITRDGAPAPGNPNWGGNARPEIYFVGVRNSQGIAFRPGTGEPFICEHGPNENDEVTRIQSGGNGGWNPNDGNGNYNGYTGALMTPTARALRDALGLSEDPVIIPPIYRTNASQGMCDCDFLSGPQWKAWDGALLVGFLSGGRGLVLPVNNAGDGLDGEPIRVLDEDDRLRAIVQGPDGAMYVALDQGEIWRVTAE